MELLQAGKFLEFSNSVSNKIADLLECEPIESLIKHAGPQRVEEYVAAEIVKLAGNININPALNIKGHQIPTIAQQLIQNYKWESLEDFTLCFRRAACGLYGEIYRVDGAVIGQWLSRYLDEKYDALEQRKEKIKPEKVIAKRENNTAHADACIKQILHNLGADKPIDETNAKENEYQRTKMAYTPPSLDTIKQKELHRQWIRENYDAITGKPLPTFIEESDWLKTQGV